MRNNYAFVKHHCLFLLLFFLHSKLFAQPACVQYNCCCGAPEEVGIPNGDFEDPPNPPSDGRITFFAGENYSTWSVLAGSIDLLGPNYINFTAGNPNGASNFIDLNGYTPGTIATTLTGLIPGSLYTIVLWYAKNSGAPSANCNILVAGGAWLNETWTSFNNGGDIWLEKCFSFTAQATSAELRFTGSGPVQNGGMLLDDMTMWRCPLDNQPPVADNPPPSPLNVECSDPFPPPADPMFSDNCSANITVQLTEQIFPQSCFYSVLRTWTATDECGNSETVTQEIQVQDTQPPELITPPANITVFCGENPIAPFFAWLADNGGALADDNCDPNVVWTNDFFGLPTAPVIEVTFTATDECQNSTSATAFFYQSGTPSTTFISGVTCDTTQAGVFTYNLTNQYGCDSTVTETVSLLPGDTTFLAFETCDPAQAGTTITVMPNQWGCDSVVVSLTNLLPPAACGVTATFSGSIIPCGASTGSLTLTATLGEPPFNFTVSLGGSPVAGGILNAVGVPEVVVGLAAGNYSVDIYSANGFSTTAQATIVQITPPALTASKVSDYNGFAVSCPGESDGGAIAIAGGGAAPYDFTWSNGDAAQQINNLGAGTYSVTVTDANNCTNTAEVILGEPPPLTFSFTINNPDCFGQNGGAIFVEPSGGVPPYRFSIDNTLFQNANVFSNLSSGTYTVTTLDANDCRRTETILINAATELIVELGDNLNIELGDSTVLQAIVNVPPDSILSVVWNPPFDSKDCPECLIQTVAPLVSTTYSVQVTALNGCKDEDKIAVIVDRQGHIFVPNVFSPNGDGENDILGIFAKPGAVRTIKSFRVFDRWGEIVFSLDNFEPNDPTVGWDGRFKGEFLNPGVFVWLAEVEFVDGTTEVFEGDVTVVR